MQSASLLSRLHRAIVVGLDYQDGRAERMVFMTGGAFTAQARQFLDVVRNPRVEKPFDFPSLRALIHNLVG
jgi:hypothetical protein